MDDGLVGANRVHDGSATVLAEGQKGLSVEVHGVGLQGLLLCLLCLCLLCKLCS